MKEPTPVSRSDKPPRGRASAENPRSRFVRLEFNSEEPTPASVETEYLRDDSRTILSRNDSPDVPFTYSVNITGHPAATVPCGFDRDGLPIGLHVIGGFGDEETVLVASAAFEEAHPWAEKRPPTI